MVNMGAGFAILKRIIELFVWDVILSALLHGLNIAGIIPGNMSGQFLSLLVGALLYIVQNVRWMRRCRFEMPSKRIYMFVNYTAYAVFVLISFVILAVTDSATYTWIFSITEFLTHTNLNISTVQSAVVFHTVMIFIIWLAPAGMEALLIDEGNTAWQEKSYTANDILMAVNSNELNLPPYIRKTVFAGIFKTATENELNRMSGLPVEDEDEF